MWFGYLMPNLNRKAWTPAEEDKLLNAAIKFGAQNWTEIAKDVENRSVYQCFVHYQTTRCHQHRCRVRTTLQVVGVAERLTLQVIVDQKSVAEGTRHL